MFSSRRGSGEISARLPRPGVRGIGAAASAVWLMMVIALGIPVAVSLGSTAALEVLAAVVGTVVALAVSGAEEAGGAVGSVDFVAASVAVKAKRRGE